MNTSKLFLLLVTVASMMFSAVTKAYQKDLLKVIQSSSPEGSPLSSYSFHVIGPKTSFSAVKGMANPTGDAITPAHLFRIASVTKTFTAAAVLRLVEQQKLALRDPIAELIDEEFDTLLKSDGYNTKQITVKQLLSHTAGLFDHAQSDEFIAELMKNPMLDKSMADHIHGCVNWGDPKGLPGENYFYSDTGYILLGHIIERTTKQPLAIAVRKLLRFEKTDTVQLVWERGDSVAVPHHLRVHQYLNGMNTSTWSPTVDLYGGGGLLATPARMARFYQRLFTGDVFERETTLSDMLSPNGLPEDSPYRLGIFNRDYDGLRIYEHSGYWGTSVMHDPETGIFIAGAVTDQGHYKTMISIMTHYLKTQADLSG